MSARRILTLFRPILMVAIVLTIVGVSSVQAQEQPNDPPERISDQEAVPGQLIVKFEEDATRAQVADARREEGLQKKEDLDLIDAEVDRVSGQSVEQAIRDLQRRPDVEYAEPDFVVHPSAYTDEPFFGELWGLNNTGQTVNSSVGTADVDIDGKEASSLTQGDPNLVVALIDDGADFTHPDLAGRAWTNPGEVPNNGVDDDANGYIDDVNGWDFHHDDNTVHDSGGDFHGTHVAGTIAASVNGQGIVGVAPNIKIMALKFIGPDGGATSDAIRAVGYAKSKGAKISNNSWGGGGYSQALKDAIDASGSLFVASAGNGGDDKVGDNNDTTPSYPASYDSPNILAVAALNSQGNLGAFSNYGSTSVDLSAPGVNIASAYPAVPAGQSSVTLSSVGSSGKAVTAGFGADEIGDVAKRASFFTKAFQAVDRGSQNVVLVDDDLSDAGFPDVGGTLSTAIQTATGVAPQEIDVAYRSDGPSLDQLQGKTVVWATGQAYLSDDNGVVITKTTLTSTDQQTLIDFLNGGGRLVLTGMDALYGIADSQLVSKTMKIGVDGDVKGKTTFAGSTGTAFAGESYTLNSSTSLSDFHDIVVPGAAPAATQGVYPGAVATAAKWVYLNGTSMAAPHATGVAALAASVEPSLLGDPVALKKLLMGSAKPAPATVGKTVSGKMVDADAAATAAADHPAPSTTATLSQEPNQAGWHNQDVSLTLSATDNQGGSGVKEITYSINSGQSTTVAGNTTTIPITTEGISNIAYHATDNRGNQEQPDKTITVRLDKSAPDTPLISNPAEGSRDNDGSFSVSGSAEEGAKVELFEGAVSRGVATAGSDGAWSIALTGVLEGTHSYKAKATDLAGNTSAESEARTVTVDTSAPEVPIISSPAEGTLLNNGSFSVSGSAEANATVELFEGGTSKGTDTADSLGNWSIDLAGVSDGSHSYTAKATDEADNASAESEARSVIVDTTAPRVKRVVPANNATDIAPGANVSAIFSEAMDPNTLTTTFKLYKKGSTTALRATVTYDETAKRAVLDPRASLERGATYKAVVTTGAKDLAGNQLLQQKVWFFTVRN